MISSIFWEIFWNIFCEHFYLPRSFQKFLPFAFLPYGSFRPWDIGICSGWVALGLANDRPVMLTTLGCSGTPHAGELLGRWIPELRNPSVEGSWAEPTGMVSLRWGIPLLRYSSGHEFIDRGIPRARAFRASKGGEHPRVATRAAIYRSLRARNRKISKNTRKSLKIPKKYPKRSENRYF